jgi:hypothetical protein
MRRSVLVTVVVLGSLVCAIGGTGLFAALTDTATSGTNSAESGAMAASADIQVATGTFSGTTIECGTFSENLATAFFTESDVKPGTITQSRLYCVKNVGSQAVTLSALADSLTDVDYACTGDEELHGDTTCGNDGAGELSSVLRANYSQYASCTDLTGGGPSPFLKDNATTPQPLGTIEPGATRCFSLDLIYTAGTPNVEAQKAQSDRVTWRYKWVAQS